MGTMPEVTREEEQEVGFSKKKVIIYEVLEFDCKVDF